jgi:predicted Zn-dependent protease
MRIAPPQASQTRTSVANTIGAGQEWIQSRRWIGSSAVVVDRGPSTLTAGVPGVSTGLRAQQARLDERAGAAQKGKSSLVSGRWSAARVAAR